MDMIDMEILGEANPDLWVLADREISTKLWATWFQKDWRSSSVPQSNPDNLMFPLICEFRSYVYSSYVLLILQTWDRQSFRQGFLKNEKTNIVIHWASCRAKNWLTLKHYLPWDEDTSMTTPGPLLDPQYPRQLCRGHTQSRWRHF